MMMLYNRVTFSSTLLAIVSSWSSSSCFLTDAFHYPPSAVRPLVIGSGPSSSSSRDHHPRDRHDHRMQARAWRNGQDEDDDMLLLDKTSSSSMQQYIRWKTTTSSTKNPMIIIWELQTAVTRFQRENQFVDLHAQIHVGSQDYFDYYNHQLGDMDRVHYELLIDQDLLLKFSNTSQILKQSVMATPHDRHFAQQYGWLCQLDVIDYCQPHWFHTDLTRQELLSQVDNNTSNQEQPLWKQVVGGGGVFGNSVFLQPALSALLVGPPTLLLPQQLTNTPTAAYRRLFTNLFLPGNALAVTLRGILWITVPSPELSILLLDWSSLLFQKTKQSSKMVLSKLAMPVLQAISTLQILPLRQLIFGQQLVQSSSSVNENHPQEWSLLITKRNDHALNILQSSLKECLAKQLDTTTCERSTKMALLYGSSHCPDLHAKLIQDGWKATETTWRTACTIDLDDGRDTTSSLMILGPLVLLLPLYLVVGGMDWITAVQDTTVDLFNDKDYAQAALELLFYIFRHVLLYVGLSKFILDLDSTASTNEN